jgi:ubiquinone/menaquinone biosynthesis C-methylase UbiE
LYLKHLQETWQKFGEADPLWSILTWPEKLAQKWEIEEFFETGRQQIDGLVAKMQSLGLSLPHGRALDFGCGVGRLTQALSPHFDRVCGVDISPAMIELARLYNRQGERCSYHLSPTNHLGIFADKSMHFVLSYITLQHIKPRYSRRYIKEFLRVLAPHGLLVFQLPTRLRTATRAERLRLKLKAILPTPVVSIYHHAKHGSNPVMDMYGIERDRIIRLMEQNGASVVHIEQDESAGSGWDGCTYFVRKQ